MPAIDEDDLLMEALEREEMDDNEMNRIKEMRIDQLRREMSTLQQMHTTQHGQYTTMMDDKDLLEVTTKEKLCVVHFFHKDFRRCQIVDRHLGELAQKHFKTRFVRVDAENVPFLVTKLQIQVLPCIIMFVDSVSVDRVVGFEELGSTDSFETRVLEWRLAKCGVVAPPRTVKQSIMGFNQDENSDDDW